MTKDDRDADDRADGSGGARRDPSPDPTAPFANITHGPPGRGSTTQEVAA
ncbi:hypothetical protein [Jannaschia sp. LMIT008]|nr:hypothetical protein [Jannaschia sp. LMIT008]